MSYPYRIQKINFHKGERTRHVMAIISENHSLVLCRYSVSGSWGRLVVERFDDGNLAARHNAMLRKSIVESGYMASTHHAEKAESLSELKRIIGPSWFKMGKEAVLHLDPDASTHGVKEPPTFEKIGSRWRLVPDQPKLVDEPPPPPKAIADHVEENANWGLF